MQDLIRPDASFTPRELFARMQGAWLEPRLGSMWQENTGVTPTVSGGQTIGLLLGLDQQQQLGPELVTNGDCEAALFANPGTVRGTITRSTELSYQGTASAKYVCAADVGIHYFATPVITVGKVYVLSAWVYLPASQATTQLYLAEAGAGFLAAGASTTLTNQWVYLSVQFRATYTTVGVSGNTTNANANYWYIDNLSVREVLGNHASQTTAANRPTLQYNGNLPLIRHADSTDVLVAAMPDLGGGVFSSAGSVYFATPQGMSCLHNQSIGTPYNLPALQTDIYGWCVFPARLAPPLEKRLELYMLRLAGLIEPDYLLDDAGDILMTDDNEFLLRA